MRLKHSRGMLTPVTKAVTIFLCFLTLSIENVTIFRESAHILNPLPSLGRIRPERSYFFWEMFEKCFLALFFVLSSSM